MEENGPCQGQGERHRLRAGQGKGGKRQEARVRVARASGLCSEDVYSWQNGG